MTETFVTLFIAVIVAIIYARLHKDSREFTKLMTALVIGMIVGIAAFNIGLTIKKVASKNNTTSITSLCSTSNLSFSPVVLSVNEEDDYLSKSSNSNESNYLITISNNLVKRSIYLWKPTSNRSPDIINDS